MEWKDSKGWGQEKWENKNNEPSDKFGEGKKS